ncbi:hypothetical protein [Borrelia hermsii]|uniref:Cytosolic protein n=2 Tax=Borrelia hermsii TaxID=140 RepID=A0AAN0X6L4_BORHE|nr:hypothetical protein [Borrelia hermsii]AMR76173.1 hypothetical protein A0V01_06180 [Borrelia hermsii]UPA08698.1 hypothetical protein bhDAH_001435 [Borrelia hermsii DAH]
MKRSILSICVLALLCLLSCDINALNELLDKSREKFLEENKKVEDLKSIEGNQEIKEEQVDIVVRIEEGVKINKNLQREGIELSLKEGRPEEVAEQQFVSQSNALTKEQENELVSYDDEANEIKSKVDTLLVSLDKIYGELNTSLSELDNMETDIVNAKFAFDKVRTSGSGIEQNVKINLHQAIDKVKSSKNIAMVRCKEQLNTLRLSKSSADSANSSIESVLRHSAQIRLNGYYDVYLLAHYMLGAKTSLNDAENMFKKVESEAGKLRNAMKQVEEDFADLKRAHQALGLEKSNISYLRSNNM